MFSHNQLHVNNVPMSRALFIDVLKSEYNILALEDTTTKYPCLRELYMNLTLNDPTEYTFATEVFNTWEFWEKLSESAIIRPVVDKWRKENMIRQKSLAVQAMKSEAAFGKSKATAARWLYDNGFTSPKPKGEEKKEIVKQVDKDTEADMKRLGLSVIKND